MKKVLWACAAAAVLCAAAPAEELPKLTEFLSGCYRDNGACQQKIKNYVDAAQRQQIICLPKDVSIREASSRTLSWLRDDANYPASLASQPFDDGLYEATIKLFPCKSEEPTQPPVPPPSDAPAAPPAQQ